MALVGSFSYALVGRGDLPQSGVKELVRFARANPGKLTMASGGTGSGQHVAGVLLAARVIHYWGITSRKEPARGVGATLTWLVLVVAAGVVLYQHF